jgi:bacteriocin-like protein
MVGGSFAMLRPPAHEKRSNEMRRKTRKQPPKVSSDYLLKTSKKKDIELTEKELDKVSGGGIYMKYKGDLGPTTMEGREKWINLYSV